VALTPYANVIKHFEQHFTAFLFTTPSFSNPLNFATTCVIDRCRHFAH
jgi:hypothetical protein